MTDHYNIPIVGLGYAGMPLAVPLVRQHDVTALNVDEERVAPVKSGQPGGR